MPHKDKFDNRAHRYVFLGYPFSQKAYKVLNLDTRKVFVSRDVTFSEHVFPFKHLNSTTPSHLFNSYITLAIDPFSDSITVPLQNTESPPIFDDPNVSDSLESSQHTSSPSVHDTSPVPMAVDNSSPSPPPVRHSTRLKTIPTKFHDFVGLPSNFHASVNSFSSTFTPKYHAFVANIFHVPEPASYKVACQHSVWCEAMASELTALEANKTWKIVPLPPGKKVVSCRWVYRVKFNHDGTVDRYKARLVARGFTQT